MSAPTPSISVIVPTLNEAENIAPLVSQILATGVPFHEIVFVDDRSTDGTQENIRALARDHRVRLIEREPGEIGLAGAVMAGAKAAEGDLILVMDADLSHPPERISDLLAPLLAGSADMVIGSRYIPGGTTPGWPLWRRMLSRTGAAFAYPLTGTHDSMSGFFAISRAHLLEVGSANAGFKIGFETIVRSGRSLRVREIPIAFRDRTRGRSKMSFAIALRFMGLWLQSIFRRVVGGNKMRRQRQGSS
jgi:dolichol-phosphate mannosyltransferase